MVRKQSVSPSQPVQPVDPMHLAAAVVALVEVDTDVSHHERRRLIALTIGAELPLEEEEPLVDALDARIHALARMNLVDNFQRLMMHGPDDTIMHALVVAAGATVYTRGDRFWFDASRFVEAMFARMPTSGHA